MTKQEEWAKSPEASKWLKETLETPMGRFFMAVLEERSELRLNVSMPPAFLTANGAAMGGRILGYERCLRTIRGLADPTSEEAKPLVETYGVLSAADATE